LKFKKCKSLSLSWRFLGSIQLCKLVHLSINQVLNCWSKCLSFWSCIEPCTAFVTTFLYKYGVTFSVLTQKVENSGRAPSLLEYKARAMYFQNPSAGCNRNEVVHCGSDILGQHLPLIFTVFVKNTSSPSHLSLDIKSTHLFNTKLLS